MGNRVSISFKNGKDESPFLFSHWEGMDFVQAAKRYVNKLRAAAEEKGAMMPLYRLEPEYVMLDFIFSYFRKDVVEKLRMESGFYLTRRENDGDNSDNGHFTIDLNEDQEDFIN